MLQVHDIGQQMTAFENTYNFQIGHEFYGRIRKDQSDNNIGSILEEALLSVIQENKTNQFIFCISNEKGGPASLFLSKKHCYIFVPHSRNWHGLPIDVGTSILASFKSWQNMILHVHFKLAVSMQQTKLHGLIFHVCCLL